MALKQPLLRAADCITCSCADRCTDHDWLSLVLLPLFSNPSTPSVDAYKRRVEAIAQGSLTGAKIQLESGQRKILGGVFALRLQGCYQQRFIPVSVILSTGRVL